VKDKLPSGKSAFITARVDSALAEKLAAKGVVVAGVPPGGLLQSLLSWGLPVLTLVLLGSFIGSRLSGRQGLGGPVVRQVAGQGLCGERYEGDLRRRCASG
jgi:cell division protease FtsH